MDFADPDLQAAFDQALQTLDRLTQGLVGKDPSPQGLYAQTGRRELRKTLGEMAAQDPLAPRAADLDRELAALAEQSRSTSLSYDLAPAQAEALNRIIRQSMHLAQERQSLGEQRRSWLRGAVQTPLRDLSRQLREDFRQGAELRRKVESFTGISPGLWDLKPGNLGKIPWPALEETSKWLASFPQILELARRIGRSRPLHPAAEPDLRQQKHLAAVQELDPESSSDWGELDGYAMGRDLQRLTGPDLARLLSPELEDLFLVQHAEGRLFIKDFREYRPIPSPRTSPSLNPPPRGDGADPRPEQGPCILCLDTSGSMAGIPELSAKAITLALTRVCMEEGRPLYLILFSDRIESRALLPGKTDLQDCLDVLALGFHGGTDLRPALDHSLEVLANPLWNAADLLIVSDFRIPKILIKRSAQIHQIRKMSQARIHALSITAANPVDDLHIFDSAWHFAIDPRGKALGFSPGAFREVLG